MMFVAWPVSRRLRDRLHGIPARAGVVLGDADEQERDDESDERSDVEMPEAEPPVVSNAS